MLAALLPGCCRVWRSKARLLFFLQNLFDVEKSSGSSRYLKEGVFDAGKRLFMDPATIVKLFRLKENAHSFQCIMLEKGKASTAGR